MHSLINLGFFDTSVSNQSARALKPLKDEMNGLDGLITAIGYSTMSQ